jgi:GT2 family glycosyltransferase
LTASVIVVVHASADHLDDSLASLTAYADSSSVEVVLVDNGSADLCADRARRHYPWVRVVRSETNLGFTGGVHLGVEAARGEVLLLLNDDAAAGEGWVEAHLEVLDRHPEAAASGGRLVSWDGARHDFVRGALTFDVHAFQLGQGWPIEERAAPASGEPLPFACGGNTAIRRRDWQQSGGFDKSLFAYFEDVALGWKLWAMGRQVVAAPDAVARHRGAATSNRLGNLRRGVLFERNALQTFFSCADEQHRAALGPAVLTTFLHRLVAFAAERPELAHLTADPFGAVPPHVPRWQRWRQRLRDRGVIGLARHLMARLLLGRRAGAPVLEDGLLLMQLQAANGFFAGFDQVLSCNASLAEQRRVPDLEILKQFPRLVVPTYLGDSEWFASDAFKSLLPQGWPLQEMSLEEILHAP